MPGFERKLVKAGALLMVIGIMPIGFYSLLGPPDGNPIGLGLLMAVLVPIGFLLLGTGLLRLLLARLRHRD
jgi:hypothetical protein